MPFDRFWQPYRSVYDEVCGRVEPAVRTDISRLGMAPFASDPFQTLRPAPLMVVSMKPYGGSGSYPCGWEERSEKPGLHRWYDGNRSGNNFVREADRLLTAVLRQMDVDRAPRDIFNTYAYFFRAADARQLKRFGLERIECTAFHRQFLETVRPQVVLCIGNGPAPSALDTYHRLLGSPPLTELKVAVRTRLRYFRDEGLLVIGVPHLSYVRADALLPSLLPLLDAIGKDR